MSEDSNTYRSAQDRGRSEIDESHVPDAPLSIRHPCRVRAAENPAERGVTTWLSHLRESVKYRV